MPRPSDQHVPAALTHTDYVCPKCGDGACPTPNAEHLENVYHRHPVEYVRVEALKAKLGEMELFDDLPDSFDMGYMQAWREITVWLAAAFDETLAPEEGTDA